MDDVYPNNIRDFASSSDIKLPKLDRQIEMPNG
jgi:hypothetical protein